MDEIPDEPANIPPGKHIYHTAGMYYIQEPSAMAAAEILAPLPGEKVLDLAAAPGGKSTHLAMLMKNTAILVANEIHPTRVWDLAENLERCGVTNAVITNNTPQQLSERFFEYFDRIMLDAPCSGEGMFRKNENARNQWNSGSPKSCSIRQSAILENAAVMLKPGGFIAYTTCTFSPDENEAVIGRFLENHDEIDLEIIAEKPGFFPSNPEWANLPKDSKVTRAVRLWPHKSKCEGHFIALFVKNSSIKNKSDIPTQYENQRQKFENTYPPKSSKALLDTFVDKFMNITLESNRIITSGTYIYYQPADYPNIHGLKVIHPGWWLGTLHKDYFSPSHALAMGINQHQVKNLISLNLCDPEIFKYLNGETFQYNAENGWILLTVEGFPIGWGKSVKNLIKNYYPRGLRKHY
jgi:NOL1/NOP2/sun family putative RNA methylase